MKKLYTKNNVLDETISRLIYIFKKFDYVYFSFSGGKDSGAMVQLADIVAKKMNRTFDLLILDVEANYTTTRIFIEEIKQLSSIRKAYHFCLPFYEDNTTSIFQPQWLMWDEKQKDQWVQPMPDDAICLKDLDTGLKEVYDRSNLNPDRFLKNFASWYAKQHIGGTVACGVGIRAQESLHRYQAIIRDRQNYDGNCWIKYHLSTNNIVNFYPLYDWVVEDIWGAHAKYDWKINAFYEQMYKMGVALSQMRICQPYGLQQRKGLNQYALIEPDTWERVVNRVSGANFGRLYARTCLLSHYKTKKPNHMSWQEYTVFLLESIGLYSRKMQDHYYRKISILIDYYWRTFQIDNRSIPDETTRKQWQEDERLWHNWKGIAKAVEKNDFSLSTRDYSLTKVDEEELYDLTLEFGSAIGIEHLPKYQLKRVQPLIEDLLKI
ncbi:DUF3440 domain-containing protein [Enterococcus faecium]|nr:DUF3440 domain-containing protein [Enterococcus faecium]